MSCSSFARADMVHTHRVDGLLHPIHRPGTFTFSFKNTEAWMFATVVKYRLLLPVRASKTTSVYERVLIEVLWLQPSPTLRVHTGSIFGRIHLIVRLPSSLQQFPLCFFVFWFSGFFGCCV